MSRKDLYEEAARSNHCNLLNGYHHMRRMEVALLFLGVVIENTKETAKILDVGCGDGLFDELIYRHIQLPIEFVGTDISALRIKMAKRRLPDTSFVVADIYHLPFRSMFDVVIMGEVIEHLYFPEVALKQVGEVLKRNGHLILDTPSKSNIVDMFLRSIGHEPTWGLRVARTHVAFYDQQSLKDLLASAGFNTMDIRGVSFLRYDLLSLLSITWNKPRWWLPKLIDTIAEKCARLRSMGAIQVFLCQNAMFRSFKENCSL